jgi:hypothetical protein
MSDEEERPKIELSLEAQEAIRTYILRFAIPSATFLTIVSGITGYVVSGLARIDATAEASKYALQAAGAAAEAKANAGGAASDATNSREKALAAAASADDTKKYLLTVKDQIDKVLTGQYEGLAKSLFAIKEFRDSIQTIPQKEVGEINSKLTEIQGVIYGGDDHAVPPIGGICPPGSFAVNVGGVSVSGGAHGYLESLNFYCRVMHFAKPK